MELVQMILKKAGPKDLNILKFIMNKKCAIELTPLYYLCQQGYRKSKKLKIHDKPPEHEKRQKILELMVQDQKDNAGNVDRENSAEWLYACSRIKHTPLHWLCYWNDYESVQYLLSLVEDKDAPMETIKMLMASTFNNMSPLSMSGKHSCGESALLILEFFDKRFYYVEKAFGLQAESPAEQETAGDDKKEENKKGDDKVGDEKGGDDKGGDDEKQKEGWSIKYVKKNQLNPV